MDFVPKNKIGYQDLALLLRKQSWVDSAEVIEKYIPSEYDDTFTGDKFGSTETFVSLKPYFGRKCRIYFSGKGFNVQGADSTTKQQLVDFFDQLGFKLAS